MSLVLTNLSFVLLFTVLIFVWLANTDAIFLSVYNLSNSIDLV